MRTLKIPLHLRSSPDRAAVCGRPELATFVFCAILFGSLLGPSCAFTAGAVRLLRGHRTDGHADCPSVVPPIVDTAAAIAGLWLGRDAMAASSANDGKPGRAVALSILAVGATFLVSAIYGYWADRRCLNAEAIDDLGVQAVSAARNGDCATARAIGAQLSVLDPDFYDAVFAHDAAIVRCLAGNVPAPLPITPAPSPVPESP